MLTPLSSSAPEEFFQLKLFVIGVAATFGSIYLYLFFNTAYIYPFLIFGAALKAWAFISCLFLYVRKRIKFKLFFEFGILNGLVAIMFVALLVSNA